MHRHSSTEERRYERDWDGGEEGAVQREVEEVDGTVVHSPTAAVAMVVALAAGVFYIVLGAIGLARTGIDDLTAEATVAGIPHTALLALIELALGALLLVAGAERGAYRPFMTFLGALLLAFGVVVLVEPSILDEWLAMETINGVIYGASGIVIIAAGLTAPIVRRRWVQRYRRDRSRGF